MIRPATSIARWLRLQYLGTALKVGPGPRKHKPGSAAATLPALASTLLFSPAESVQLAAELHLRRSRVFPSTNQLSKSCCRFADANLAKMAIEHAPHSVCSCVYHQIYTIYHTLPFKVEEARARPRHGENGSSQTGNPFRGRLDRSVDRMDI